MEKKKQSSKRGITKPNPSKNKINTKTNQPLKVVHISNPMKVKTSAAGFRALVQRLTGKGADWPVDPAELGSSAAHDFSDNQAAPNSHNYDDSNDVSIIAASNCTGLEKGGGVEVSSGTADPSPDMSADSSDLYFPPLDYEYDDDNYSLEGDDDRVVLIDHRMMMLDDYNFTGLIQSGGVDSLINV